MGKSWDARMLSEKRTYKSVGRTGRIISWLIGGAAVMVGIAYEGVVRERPLLVLLWV